MIAGTHSGNFSSVSRTFGRMFGCHPTEVGKDNQCRLVLPGQGTKSPQVCADHSRGASVGAVVPNADNVAATTTVVIEVSQRIGHPKAGSRVHVGVADAADHPAVSVHCDGETTYR